MSTGMKWGDYRNQLNLLQDLFTANLNGKNDTITLINNLRILDIIDSITPNSNKQKILNLITKKALPLQDITKHLDITYKSTWENIIHLKGAGIITEEKVFINKRSQNVYNLTVLNLEKYRKQIVVENQEIVKQLSKST